MRNKGAYIWNFGGRLLPQFIYLLTNILLAHYLTPAEFGEIGVLAIFISISSTLTDSGFGGSIIKERNVSKIDLSTVFVYNLGVSVLMYSALFLSSPYIEEYFRIPGLSGVARTLGLVFVINAWTLIPKTILIREIKFKQIAIVAVIGVLISSAVAIYSALNGYGVYALVLYQIVYALSDLICFKILTKYRHSFTFSIASFKKLFSFGFYTTLCNVLESAYVNILTAMFGKFLGVSAAGYLYQAQKLESSATNSLATTINTVSFPILVKLKEDRASFVREANSLIQTFSLCLFPLFWIVVVYSKEIITIIFGEEWQEAGIYLSALMVVGIFYILESLTRNFIKSLGEVKKLAKYTLMKRLVGVFCILALLVFGPYYMLLGYLISTIFGLIVNIYLYARILNIKMIWTAKKYIKTFALTLWSLIGFFLVYQIGNIGIEIALGVMAIFVYYLIILPKISGIKILSFFIKKNIR